MNVEIRQSSFDPLEELRRYQAEQPSLKGQYGAIATFIGVMRDFNEGEGVSRMTLEHYPGMTERHLHHIVEDAKSRWGLLDALVIHRVGALYPDDPIVLVAVWTSHRAEAFEACRFIMEDLKSKAPFWKKETLADGERWVEKNTAGYTS